MSAGKEVPMANIINGLCMNCMGLLDQDGHCPHCKHSNIPENPIGCLPLHTVLDNHYHLGKVLRKNGESCVYLAFDSYTQKSVEIREYCPTTLCHRAASELVPVTGEEIQYKAFLSEFTDLHRALMRLKNIPILLPVLDLFEANNTMYVVSQRFDGIRFGDFLNINVGELTWDQAKGFFLPLLLSLQSLHDNSLLHRAISPDTLLINKAGDMKLIDFCLPSVRTMKCELEAELYGGYAAPEQYNISSWQGTWTDVYAVAAVMYKTLTGSMPPDALNRKGSDGLITVSELNPSVPVEVSRILERSLALDPNARIKTISELKNLLSRIQEGGIGEQDTRRVAVKEDYPKNEGAFAASVTVSAAQSRKKRRKPHYGLLSAVLSTLVMVSLVLYLLYNMYQERQQVLLQETSVSSVESSDLTTTMVVPKVTGDTLEAAQNNSEYAGKITFSVVEENNADYEEGMIFEQSPKAGEQMLVGGVLNVKVSAGAKKVPMPKVVGLAQEDVIKALDALEIDYEVIPAYSDEYKKGEVTRTNYEEGADVTLNKDVVFLFVNQQEKEENSSSSSSKGTLGLR